MRQAFCYRLLPDPASISVMDRWGELLRRQWNHSLGAWLDWENSTRCYIGPPEARRCRIKTGREYVEPIGAIPGLVDVYSLKRALVQSKELFPEYRDIYSDALQELIIRLGRSWKRWKTEDKTGKRGGRPRFKKEGSLPSITYARVNCAKAGAFLEQDDAGWWLRCSRIGRMKVILHRSIPEGMVLKTVTLTKKADGWYACFSCEDKSIPDPAPLPADQIRSSTGIDVGLEKFAALADGRLVHLPKAYASAQKRRTRLARQASRKQKGSANWQKAQQRLARLELHVHRQRAERHYQVAHDLCQEFDLIGVEKLNIRGLARTKLGKSILDNSWGAFITKLQAVAVKRGKRVEVVSAYGSSQECSGCGTIVKKDGLHVRWHLCPHCGCSLDRDVNAARVIHARARQAVGLPLAGCGGSGNSRPLPKGAPRGKQQRSAVRQGSPRQSVSLTGE